MVLPVLPTPTGSHPVGVASSYLVDVSRPDPWVPEVPSRELMISIWYPAVDTRGPRAPYLTPTESSYVLAGSRHSVAPHALSTVRTHAFPDAPLAPGLRELPLVVLSPGFSRTRATLTSIGEDLASHGYVAVAIDHTHETAATTFPDGRVAAFALGHGFVRDAEFWRTVKTGRARDVSFVLDQLFGSSPPWEGAEALAPDMIGMVGHSVGGAATIAAMISDERIRAGSNVDGSTDPLIPDAGLDRPLLFLGRDGQYAPGDGPAADTWARDWPLLTGWKRWLVVAGAQHPSFTDLGLLAEQFGVPLGARTSGLRTTEITRACLRAFFDQHVRGVRGTPFDRLLADFPEVRSCLPHDHPSRNTSASGTTSGLGAASSPCTTDGPSTASESRITTEPRAAREAGSTSGPEAP
ncbi:alpha/beta hydrolase family protein [Streptomyces sp. NPDC091368]|uniref:alpha/beta hydrolase family protein n=1 Tax=Streptomyces sp. NPDC091368 TaxID=3365993 RepID=UPI00380000A9